MFAEMAPMRHPDETNSDNETTHSLDPLSCVTEVITTVVEPGKESVFQAWAEDIQASQAQFPGYMGTLFQAPLSAEVPYWTTLVRFSPASARTWLSSPLATVARTVNPEIATWKSHRMASPFAGWFPASENPPPAWKQTALVLLMLFPVVMLEIKFLSPHLAGLDTAIATFIGNAISVSLMSWPLMKIAVRGMGWWLRCTPARRWQREVLGACTMLALYGIELAIFMLLF